MYRLGYIQPKKRRWPLFVGAGSGLLLLVAVLIIVGFRFLNPKTTIKQAAPVVTKVAASTLPVKIFDVPEFSVELPSDWHQILHTSQPYNLYRWQSGGSSTNSRFFEAYVDTTPANFTVNRVLAVEDNGPSVTVIGSVSDNCTDFTKETDKTANGYGTLGKWQGVDFLCDMHNYERNVVGTSSKDAINAVTLDNGTEKHKLFFTFTDHNVNPDYSTLYSALASFKLK